MDYNNPLTLTVYKDGSEIKDVNGKRRQHSADSRVCQYFIYISALQSFIYVISLIMSPIL